MITAILFYFGIGLASAIGFLILAYFDSDDAKLHADMIVTALEIFFIWPYGFILFGYDIIKDRINKYKYDKMKNSKY